MNLIQLELEEIRKEIEYFSEQKRKAEQEMKVILQIQISIHKNQLAELRKRWISSWIADYNSACGLIYDGEECIGSGFVLDDRKQVITCAHSFIELDGQPQTQNGIYFTNQTPKEAQIKKKLDLVKYLSDYDISLWKCTDDLCITPIKTAIDHKITLHEEVYYYGYHKFPPPDNKVETKSFGYGAVNVIGQTKTKKNGHTIDFIELIDEQSLVSKGYSGGLTFNKHGERLRSQCTSIPSDQY